MTGAQVLRMNDGVLPVAPPVLSRAFQAVGGYNICLYLSIVCIHQHIVCLFEG